MQPVFLAELSSRSYAPKEYDADEVLSVQADVILPGFRPQAQERSGAAEMCIQVFKTNLRFSSLNGMRKSSHSPRNVPPKRSQNEFVVGALSAFATPARPWRLPRCPLKKMLSQS